MPDSKKRDPSRSGDLAQAAAVITQLVQLDYDAENRIKQAEEIAAQSLDSVAPAILALEQEASNELMQKLDAHKQQQEVISARSIEDADLRYARAHQILREQYEQHKDSLARELVKRVLEIKP